MAGERTGGAVVLVVEDDPTQREIAHALLEHYGFAVVAAATGEDAVRIAREQRVDLVLTDVMLPGADGWNTCQSLKLDPRTGHIPVVVTSIYDIDRRMIAASGCDRFVPKPWRINELVPLVRELIERAAGAKRPQQ